MMTPSAPDDVVRIASCSFMVPVKRLDLLYRGLQATARLKPAHTFEWHHIGDGPTRAQIEALAQATNPSNLTCHFWGRLQNEEVMAFYKNHPIDFFMNVSASEGIPLSIMEAQSCGIPVIATAVGGNPEIVSEETGHLLSPNPTPTEIAAAISTILDTPQALSQKRLASRAMWQTTYNADANYSAFAARLKSLLS
jgi:glycosyltransferase involved in cell wall biosynthesis